MKGKPTRFLRFQVISNSKYEFISPEVESAPVWDVNNEHKVPSLEWSHLYFSSEGAHVFCPVIKASASTIYLILTNITYYNILKFPFGFKALCSC